MFRFVFAAVLCAATLSAVPGAATAASASGTDCPEHFAAGTAPVITNPKLQPRTRTLCFDAYAVLHSGLSRTPLYAAERLTRANLLAAKKLSRKDSFHAEDALPSGERAELSDYARSGYDRGHLAPNGDMPTRRAQAQSFSLANMVPQVHANNAGVWAGIEGAARQLATDEGEIYVVSGPAFLGGDVKQIGRVLVPTHLWKVIYSPRQQRAGAYVITNDTTRDYSAMSVSELERLVGVRALPGVSQKVRDAGMTLPRPQAQGGGNGKNGADSNGHRKGSGSSSEPAEFDLKELSRSLLEALRRATH